MTKLLFFLAIFTSQILVAQNVGIGITVPLAPLHISTGASGNLTPFSPLVVEGNNNTYINLLSPNNRETGLLFGKADNAASGAIVYNNVNTLNGFQFRTNGNITQMILNNVGNLGIGLSTPNAKLSISVNGTELVGTAASNILRTNAGTLETTLGSEISLANIGFLSPNNSSLGIRAYRSSPVTGWENTAILLGMDVDNTVRAGGGFLAIGANGNIGVNTGTPQVSAALDVTSTAKGFLPPRMTSTQRDAIPSPVAGLQIWCIDCKQLQVYNGSVWQTASASPVYYPIVWICCNPWMTKNLDVATYRNGDPIPKVTDNDAWVALTTGAYCYYNNDSATYAATYGKLYNGYAVNDPRGLAPEGWHIPTDFEWTTLENCLGGSSVAGGAMKEIGTTHWQTPNTAATNISGFTGLPAGYRNGSGTFLGFGNSGYWWSSTEELLLGAWYRYLHYLSGDIFRANSNKRFGFSVRCLRD